MRSLREKNKYYYRNIGKMENLMVHKQLFCLFGPPMTFSSTITSNPNSSLCIYEPKTIFHLNMNEYCNDIF